MHHLHNPEAESSKPFASPQLQYMRGSILAASHAAVPQNCRQRQAQVTSPCSYQLVRITRLLWSQDGATAHLDVIPEDDHDSPRTLLCPPDQFMYLAPFLSQQPLDGCLTLPICFGPGDTLCIDWHGALEQCAHCQAELKASGPAPALIPPPQ